MTKLDREILLRAASAIHDFMAENAALREQLSAMERFHQDDALRIAALAALLREARDTVAGTRLLSSPYQIAERLDALVAKLDAALEQEAHDIGDLGRDELKESRWTGGEG